MSEKDFRKLRAKNLKKRLESQASYIRTDFAILSSIALIAGFLWIRDAHAMPFSGCTFYKSHHYFQSFAGGATNSGCAEFSAVNGRNGCQKVKGVCPACVTYNGDDVQMWLPDYFIEVTKHIGKSAFTLEADGAALKTHLKLGVKWWDYAMSPGVSNTILSNGDSSSSARLSFWHARILTVPYGSWSNNFPPLAASVGTGLPACFSAMSEFMPSQWNLNLADATYALKWAPVGVPACLSPIGGGINGLVTEARSAVSQIASAGSGNRPNYPVDLTCANPVGAKEAYTKNAIPGSDALAPLSGDPSDIASKLCMGSWGNLLPRTGWIGSEDPHKSALMAAYKFMSAAGDFHLNSNLKLRNDDKWQIVYPPRVLGKCFRPGSPFMDLPMPAADDPLTRGRDEINPTSPLRNQTYIIAVWRRRNSCEEPLQAIGGWTADYKLNLAKNKSLCSAVSGR